MHGDPVAQAADAAHIEGHVTFDVGPFLVLGTIPRMRGSGEDRSLPILVGTGVAILLLVVAVLFATRRRKGGRIGSGDRAHLPRRRPAPDAEPVMAAAGSPAARR